MPIHGDAIETMNIILKGWLGPNRAVGSPASYLIELYQDNPQGDSPALADWGGYTAPTWSADDWLTPDGGQIESDGLPSFGAPTSAGTDAARYWALSTAPNTPVYSAPLESPISVNAASANPVRIRMTVPFGGRD